MPNSLIIVISLVSHYSAIRFRVDYMLQTGVCVDELCTNCLDDNFSARIITKSAISREMCWLRQNANKHDKIKRL